MTKKMIANVVMVAIIMVIVAAGILGVGHIQGWFDADDGSQAVLCDMRGVIRLEREGVSYKVEGETVLRTGDQITCEPGATTVVRLGSSTLTLGENAAMIINEPSAVGFSGQVTAGEVFANCEEEAALSFAEKTVTLSQTTALLSVRTGAQSISVLRGSVEDAAAGQVLNFIGDEQSVSKLDIHSLNDFTITQIRSVGDGYALCFTLEELDQLAADRLAAMEALINDQTKPTEEKGTAPTGTEPDDGVTTPSQMGGSVTQQDPSAPTQGTQTPATEPAGDTTKPTQVGDGSSSNTEPSATTAPVETTQPPVTSAPPETTAPAEETTAATEPPASQEPAGTPVGKCSITIRCDTILNNMEDLTPGKAGYVPSNGVILPVVTVDIYEGETAFDVLKRACNAAGIQLEYKMSIYGSYYIEGINNLYEFDCGGQSGWMYKVNEWFPNYGCSDYKLKDGDVIAFLYTCQGLGTDVGAPEWEG